MEQTEKNRPNILFFFSDQQRFDTLGCMGQPLLVTPVLDRLAAEGVLFREAYSPQPVCGPCRAMFQSGRYPTEINCFRNNQALPMNRKNLADYFEENGYETAYIGKWHLASNGSWEKPDPETDFWHTPVPPERRGGYHGFWRASDTLEFTSHGQDGYVFDEKGKRIDFKGYRVDCITDFALEFLEGYNGKKPFFMTISQIEPHHQNDHKHYEGPKGSKKRFADFTLPGDLQALGGNAAEEYPDYLGCCRSLDDNLGRIIEELKQKGLYENTIIVYASDHGSHFQTRNRDAHLCGGDDYKRSCHSSALHVPLVIAGPGYRGGKQIEDLVSTASLPKSFLAMGGIQVGDAMVGEDLKDIADGHTDGRANRIFAQISESRVGRCIRTEQYLYSVYAPGLHGAKYPDSDYYEEDFFYDIKKDPYELDNLAGRDDYLEIRRELAEQLQEQILQAEGIKCRIQIG